MNIELNIKNKPKENWSTITWHNWNNKTLDNKKNIEQFIMDDENITKKSKRIINKWTISTGEETLNY